MSSPSNIYQSWKQLRRLPGGRHAFSKGIKLLVPYSGSISAFVEELRPGYCRVHVKDHRAIRNHLNSIHAIALMNLAELASGLAFNAGMPRNAMAILTNLNITYTKKARGTLTAECTCEPPPDNEKQTYILTVTTHDESGDVVTEAKATWLVSPKRKSKSHG